LLEAPVFGIMGSILGNALFLPQIVKTVKSKSTRDLSTWTYIQIIFNGILWTGFGVQSGQPIIYISNLVSVVLAIAVVGMKKVYK